MFAEFGRTSGSCDRRRLLFAVCSSRLNPRNLGWRGEPQHLESLGMESQISTALTSFKHDSNLHQRRFEASYVQGVINDSLC